MKESWSQMQTRLERAAHALERSAELTAEQARAVMDERANALASVGTRDAAPLEVIEVVTFAVAHQRYAIEAKHVRSVATLASYTMVPGLPSAFVGVTTVRGQLVALLNLTAVLSPGQRHSVDAKFAVVLGGDYDEVAVVADSVDEMHRMPASDILPAPTFGDEGSGLVRGLTAEGVVLLEGAAVLSDGRFTVDAP